MKRPLFSCVVPVKGSRPYMGAALESLRFDVQGLTSPDELEIIIQDDDIDPDQGQADALNKGFAKAKGEWLFWLNADDMLLQGALQKVKTAIHSTTTTSDYDSIQWIAGNMVEIDKEGRILRCVRDVGRKGEYRGLPVRTCGPSAFFRRELFEKVGGFDASFRYCMDTDLWCRFRTAGHWYKKIPDYIWGFRIHEGSQTASPTNSPEEHARQRAEILRLNEKHGLHDSRAAFLPLRLSRIFDGSYLKGWLDTRRMKGLSVTGGKSLAIWIHSTCRSTAALVRETKRQAESAGCHVTVCEWGLKSLPSDRLETIDGLISVGDDLEKGRAILREHGGPGSVQVFCVYQNSSVWRKLMVEAKKGGARVVVYSEAPCEMCLGLTAALKRLYYRFVLPWRLRAAVHAADLFISASGKMGIDRLLRLGWPCERIVPFGYSSPRLVVGKEKKSSSIVNLNLRSQPSLRVLHVGSEAAYRGVGIVEEAAKIADVELVKTGGKMSEEELVAEIRRADIVVGCGYCEPWGMRINDALLEGTPVIVSDGMGVACVCEWYGCGCVVPRGDVSALAKVLKRCKDEPAFLAKLRNGAQTAAQELLPENRAKVFLNAVLSAKPLEVCEANGMVVVDQFLRKHGVIREDEVWVHGMWTPDKWRKCISAWITGKKLVRMTHGSLSPIYLEKQGKWKKRLVAPIERWLFKRTDRVVVTCEAEKKWCQEWGLRNEFEILDLKRFFDLKEKGEGRKEKGDEQEWYDIIDPWKILDMPIVDISNAAYLSDRKEIKLAFHAFGRVVNETDGRTVVFPAASAGKMWFNSGTDIRGIAAEFANLFRRSLRAWSEPNVKIPIADKRRKLEAVHQYLSKFSNAGGEYYVRFTVKENIGGKSPRAEVHASVISSIHVYKKTEGAELSIPIKTQAEDSAPFVDNKIALFLGAVNGGEVNRCLHLLYLGRRHPLKGVNYLEQAVEELNQSFEHSEHSNIRTIDLRIVSDHFGEELERDWEWCDVLVLPTLSENFGLVVAEALERGKRVITTDGAPAWGEGGLFDCSDCSDCSIGYGGRLIYLKGYRDGTDEERVRMLKEALEKVSGFRFQVSG